MGCELQKPLSAEIGLYHSPISYHFIERMLLNHRIDGSGDVEVSKTNVKGRIYKDTTRRYASKVRKKQRLGNSQYCNKDTVCAPMHDSIAMAVGQCTKQLVGAALIVHASL
jgi:hypothetical protein